MEEGPFRSTESAEKPAEPAKDKGFAGLDFDESPGVAGAAPRFATNAPGPVLLSRSVKPLATPLADLLNGLDRCLTRGVRSLGLVLLGTLAGWWIYVPVHELLHAAACAAAGGQVSRLEIDGLYGGALLARVFPFVVSGSAYAGRLSGWNTRGSDWIYLATDLGPFVLTLFPGVWLMRRAAGSGRGFLFGFSLPFALAPFLSLTGDAYEIGSILVTKDGRVRGDDLFKIAEALGKTEGAPWGAFTLAALLGLVWAYLTWAAGAWVARRLGQPAIRR